MIVKLYSILPIKHIIRQGWRYQIPKIIKRSATSGINLNLSPKEIIEQKQAKHKRIRKDGVLYMAHNPKPIKNDTKKAFFKRSDKGLYANCCIRFGNNVPKSKHKTRRKWLPNIQKKSLYSKALNTFIQLKVSMRALRTIVKVGGLDEYVTGNKPARLKELSARGWELREMVLAAQSYKDASNVEESKDKKESS
ncbi:ribosomal protein L28 [Pneumocystis jirovecii RU7]|uniref:Large ribosomal subunit protein bL28c n=1 Tax=Pneumocystis jirovecii (strain RU7) TaxID=1408657 RepID=A0A0W4ZVQ4_PNEJ7|nr:ribosomal protein L28 [Pneumocystis jirovecii RU7]KTW32458.1 ribosomal protein L28 [Pneumocystis jirovecii RU7]